MNKRLFLAFGLFFVFMLVFQMLFMPQPQPQKPAVPGATNRQSGGTGTATKPLEPAKPLADDVLKKADIPAVDNGLLSVGLNSVDGSVSSLKFLKYKEDGKQIDFIEQSIPFLRNFRVLFPGMSEASLQEEAVFSHKKTGNLQHEFSHTYKSGPAAGLEVVKTYTFYPDKYHFDLSVTVRNTLAKPWKNPTRTIDHFSLVWGSPINWKKNKAVSGVYDANEFIYCELDGDVENTGKDRPDLGAVKWLGLKDRYFFLAVIPVNPDGTTDTGRNRAGFLNLGPEGRKLKTFGFNFRNDSRDPLVKDQSVKANYRIVLSPIKYDLLVQEEYVNKGYNFENLITSFPLVRQVSILLEKLIFWIQGGIANFGIVIILVTILMKLVLYPLTHKSAVSMKKVQLLQPKLAALKEQYRNSPDPRLLQQKTMELYKKEKVNPMGGCLPILLQLPIFIALYQVLPRLVDMKDVAFLWIKDLSSPDTLFELPFFKSIPLILPDQFNLLPIIMTVVSILQTKFSQASSGPQTAQQAQQKKMMLLMPIMFLFLFWNMPSGLVLYWTVQNILSIVEQSFINRKFDAQLAAAN